MNFIDKRIWLEKHGVVYRYIAYESTTCVKAVQWKTHGGLQFRSDGFTQEQVWENLFKDVKETLFMIINDPSYHAWNRRTHP